MLLWLVACSSSQSNSNTDGPTAAQQAVVDTFFSSSLTQLTIEVFYEDGHAPYTGNLGLGGDLWGYTTKSLDALFESFENRTVVVDTQLSQMTAFASQDTDQWTLDALQALAEAQFTPSFTSTEAQLALIFVGGQFAQSDTVLGLHIPGTYYAFVFQEVIDNISTTEISKQQIQQAVVVHELGHALGLVHNGLPMVEDHEDDDHPKHTIDENDVMFWAVESSSNVQDFVGGLAGATENLFGPNSLQDAQNYQP